MVSTECISLPPVMRDGFISFSMAVPVKLDPPLRHTRTHKPKRPAMKFDVKRHVKFFAKTVGVRILLAAMQPISVLMF